MTDQTNDERVERWGSRIKTANRYLLNFNLFGTILAVILGVYMAVTNVKTNPEIATPWIIATAFATSNLMGIISEFNND